MRQMTIEQRKRELTELHARRVAEFEKMGYSYNELIALTWWYKESEKPMELEFNWQVSMYNQLQKLSSIWNQYICELHTDPEDERFERQMVEFDKMAELYNAAIKRGQP